MEASAATDPQNKEEGKKAKRSGGSHTPAMSTLRNKALTRIGQLLDNGLDDQKKIDEFNALVQGINYGLHDPQMYQDNPPTESAQPDIAILATAVVEELRSRKKAAKKRKKG